MAQYSYTVGQISQWNRQEIAERLDFIRSHLDAGGICSARNGVELLVIAEHALALIPDGSEGF